jgi:dihydroorotate dehydrogenase
LSLHGLTLPSPVGLAPGFDKDCDVLASLMHLGFGYLAPGAIMEQPRPGNPAPRMGRIVDQQAVINCMGLPSKGREHAIANLRRLRRRRIPIFADVQATTPEQLVENVAAIQPHAEALEVGLECPNTHDTDPTREMATAIELVHRIAEVRQKPVFVKIPHNVRVHREERLRPLLDACLEARVEGIIATATQRIQTDKLSIGYGQLAGRPSFAPTLDLVRAVADYTGGRLSLIAGGGVMTGRDAYEMLAAGACAVEILSALVYRGWRAPALISRELLNVLDEEGVDSVQALADRASGVAAR